MQGTCFLGGLTARAAVPEVSPYLEESGAGCLLEELRYLQGGPHPTAVSPCSPAQRDYEDSICFRKAEGEFSVTLRATLPRPCLSFPAAVRLPVCAVHSLMETTFTVRNVG